MKRYAWLLSLSVMAVAAGFITDRDVKASENGASISGPEITLANATRGVVFFTAAINSNGTVASCFNCNGVKHLATGEYQVGFNTGAITANNGWSRFVQVDTLSIGSISNVSCTTADRFGVLTAIYVNCFNGAGVPTDTSFFLFVAR